MFRHNFNSSAAMKLHLFDILFVAFALRRQPESEHILIRRIRDLFIYAEWLAVDEMATQNIFGKAKYRTKKKQEMFMIFPSKKISQDRLFSVYKIMHLDI